MVCCTNVIDYIVVFLILLVKRALQMRKKISVYYLQNERYDIDWMGMYNIKGVCQAGIIKCDQQKIWTTGYD